jgi:hypothetical protein
MIAITKKALRWYARLPLPAGSVIEAIYFCVPNSPAGRSSSTIAMMMKITVFDASG